MESETTNTKKMSLEARLGYMIFNSAASGFMTCGVIEQILRGNYKTAALIGFFDIGSAIGAYYYAKNVIKDYKK